jgi:hypothetical protein
MKIEIRSDKKISEFQTEFTCLFPYLKVEFFTHPHNEGAASWSKYMHFDHTKTLGEIGEISKILNKPDFDFTPQLTVGAFEQTLWGQYGLAVQVFRKSMGIFIESTSTDSWTLEEQNKKGEDSTHNIIEMVYNQRTNDD